MPPTWCFVFENYDLCKRFSESIKLNTKSEISDSMVRTAPNKAFLTDPLDHFSL